MDLAQATPFVFSLLAAGSFAGILAGLFGVGGGIVIVPVLYFLLQGFDVNASSAMAIATATSLATIVPTAISSTRTHHKNGNVDIELLKWWSPFIVLSAIAGSLLATKVSGQFLTWLFGSLAVLVSLNMAFRSNAHALFKSLPGRVGQSIMASMVGGLSVMVGIGGGTVGVPLMTSFNVSAHRAVGTAAAFGLLIALPGVVTLVLAGETPQDAPVGTWQLVHLPAIALIVPLTVLFAPLGAKLANRMKAANLKKAFAGLLFFTGMRMLWQVV